MTCSWEKSSDAKGNNNGQDFRENNESSSTQWETKGEVINKTKSREGDM